MTTGTVSIAKPPINPVNVMYLYMVSLNLPSFKKIGKIPKYVGIEHN